MSWAVFEGKDLKNPAGVQKGYETNTAQLVGETVGSGGDHGKEGYRWSS